MKLGTRDIKILNEAQQFRKMIANRFGSVEAFTEYANRSGKTFRKYKASTVNTYLSYGDLPESFKIYTVSALNKSYHEIFKSPSNQIYNQVIQVYEYIDLYESNNDFDILTKLKSRCEEYSLTLELSMMHRNIGKYYFKINRVDLSIVEFLTACSLIKGRDKQLLMSYLNELSYVYFYLKNYSKYNEIVNEIKDLIKFGEYPVKELQLFYYRQGLYYHRNSCYLKSRIALYKSMLFADDLIDKASVARITMNIGMSYKKEGRYPESLKYYFKSVPMYEQYSNHDRCVVYSNIAELFRTTKKYNRAIVYIKKALENVENKDDQSYFTCIFTYIQIKLETGDTESAFEDLILQIENSKGKSIHKKFILDGINAIIIYGRDYSDVAVLDRIELLLIKLYEEASDIEEEYKSTIISLLGQVRIYKIKCEGGKNHE